MVYNGDFDRSPAAPSPKVLPTAVKLLVAGGFGVGKTTFVGAASEIAPLSTEETITTASIGTDDMTGLGDKETTTVALDFGRITLDQRHILYLFGTPGQDRFWFMWNELSEGAFGAVVLADTRRLEDCFPALDFFERRGTPFIVAVNEFDGSYHYDPEEVRAALDLKPNIPIVCCDARDPRSATLVLVTLTKHLMSAAAVTAPLGALHDLFRSRFPSDDHARRPGRARTGASPARVGDRRSP